MKFRTEITIPPFGFHICHSDKMAMTGSCFVENISSRMRQSGFRTDTNPFGIIYNPASLSKGMREMMSGKEYAMDDLFEYRGIFHSFSHHSHFSDMSPEKALDRINERLRQAAGFLKEASVLLVTWGTAWVFSLRSSGVVVSNCHQLPDSLFYRYRLTINDIVSEWADCIVQLRKENPELKIIFTVSPVRHWKDGIHENQLSKSILLLAADTLIQSHDRCYYFPSYEILMDDLRDYRFYADDMSHPSASAVDYIWERFSTTLFSPQTLQILAEWKDIQQALAHRPFHPDSDEYQSFLKKIQKKKEAFCRRNPSFFIGEH